MPVSVLSSKATAGSKMETAITLKGLRALWGREISHKGTKGIYNYKL